MKVKTFLISFSLIGVIFLSLIGGALSDRIFGYKLLDKWFPRLLSPLQLNNNKVQERTKIVSEESVVIDVVDKVSPSVVTVGIKKTKVVGSPFQNFYDPFGIFGLPQQKQQQKKEKIEQDIGSGFILNKEGLIVTNKHVVSDTDASYKVITKDNKDLEVKKIYRDPIIDLAILKVDPPTSGLKPLEMGDSSKLKVGQFVIAIGTALGEFRNTVTTGVISGLGRGINAGDPFGGYSERLENVIQTDAAINPGNSGGPLLNSAGQVIGVDVAMSQSAQNINFAIPINIVKKALNNFNKTGRFERPFLGIKYKMISIDLALLNEVPEGAYILEVVDNSAAAESGLKKGDIIVKIDGQKINDKNGDLIKIIQSKKVGDKINLEIWRDGKTKKVRAVLKTAE